MLEKYLFRMTGARSDDIVLPPRVGVDFGVVRVGQGYLVVSSDPVTGVSNRIGWYAVNVSANDVATSGNRPQFLQSIILLPHNATIANVKRISTQMHIAAERLGIAIVGGHTELTPGLNRPIVVTTAFAFASSFVSAADACEGDIIMMTKTAGVEGTSILAHSLRARRVKLEPGLVRRARGFLSRISVVEEAQAAFKTGHVHAMHDATEGGVLGSVFEMASASNLGFEIVEAEIPIATETVRICTELNADPLKLISSGTLLLAVRPGKEVEVKGRLREFGIPACSIGRFGTGRKTLVCRDGHTERIDSAVTDEIWRLQSRLGFALREDVELP
jgi:hydrogenase maturation factor